MEKNEAGFVFMRHGKTSWNIENRIQGSTDISLLPESINETRDLALKVKDEGIQFCAVYTLFLQRAIETGEFFKNVLGIKRHFIEPKFNGPYF